MRVVVSGHTFVQRENWARWERFAELYPDSCVTLLVPSAWNEDRYGIERSFTTHTYEKENFRVLPVKQMHLFGRGLHRTLGLMLKDLQPNIYFITEERYGWWPYQEILYKRIYCKGAITVGNCTTQEDYKLTRLRYHIKEYIYFNEMDAIIAVNKEACRILRGHGYNKPIFIQQVNGADEKLWHPGKDEQLRRMLRLNDFNIGYVGSLRYEKGVLDLVEAVTGLENDAWSLTIIGDGPLKNSMIYKLEKEKVLDNVRFLGYLERKDIPKYIRELDVLVLPSKTLPDCRERFGVVLVEAMLSGVAVIGSSCGGIPEVIGDSGLIFEEGNVRQLRECLRLLMNNSKLREELAEKGRKRALERYSATAMSKQIYEFFNQLLVDKRKLCESS